MNEEKVLVADNQFLTREGILSLLKKSTHKISVEIVVFKTELIEKVTVDKPAIVILDPDTFDFDSLDEIGSIRRYSPLTEILVISNNLDNNEVHCIIEAGVNQYILKGSDEKEFHDAFTAALSGKRYLCSEILDIVLSKKHQSEQAKLTSSEVEIIRLLAEGLTAKEIASKKFISVHTVNTHRKNIFRKLKVNSTSELIMFSIRSGIIDTTEYYI
jgi:DNA-binding NarL/FixJ family response regulator